MILSGQVRLGSRRQSYMRLSDVNVVVEKLRGWMEKFAKNNKYNSAEKQRANNFLQVLAGPRLHLRPPNVSLPLAPHGGESSSNI